MGGFRLLTSGCIAEIMRGAVLGKSVGSGEPAAEIGWAVPVQFRDVGHSGQFAVFIVSRASRYGDSGEQFFVSYRICCWHQDEGSCRSQEAGNPPSSLRDRCVISDDLDPFCSNPYEPPMMQFLGNVLPIPAPFPAQDRVLHSVLPLNPSFRLLTQLLQDAVFSEGNVLVVPVGRNTVNQVKAKLASVNRAIFGKGAAAFVAVKITMKGSLSSSKIDCW